MGVPTSKRAIRVRVVVPPSSPLFLLLAALETGTRGNEILRKAEVAELIGRLPHMTAADY